MQRQQREPTSSCCRSSWQSSSAGGQKEEQLRCFPVTERALNFTHPTPNIITCFKTVLFTYVCINMTVHAVCKQHLFKLLQYKVGVEKTLSRQREFMAVGKVQKKSILYQQFPLVGYDLLQECRLLQIWFIRPRRVMPSYFWLHLLILLLFLLFIDMSSPKGTTQHS